jgi:hypothetical protein
MLRELKNSFQPKKNENAKEIFSDIQKRDIRMRYKNGKFIRDFHATINKMESLKTIFKEISIKKKAGNKFYKQTY